MKSHQVFTAQSAISVRAIWIWSKYQPLLWMSTIIAVVSSTDTKTSEQSERSGRSWHHGTNGQHQMLPHQAVQPPASTSQPGDQQNQQDNSIGTNRNFDDKPPMPGYMDQDFMSRHFGYVNVQRFNPNSYFYDRHMYPRFPHDNQQSPRFGPGYRKDKYGHGYGYSCKQGDDCDEVRAANAITPPQPPPRTPHSNPYPQNFGNPYSSDWSLFSSMPPGYSGMPSFPPPYGNNGQYLPGRFNDPHMQTFQPPQPFYRGSYLHDQEESGQVTNSKGDINHSGEGFPNSGSAIGGNTIINNHKGQGNNQQHGFQNSRGPVYPGLNPQQPNNNKGFANRPPPQNIYPNTPYPQNHYHQKRYPQSQDQTSYAPNQPSYPHNQQSHPQNHPSYPHNQQSHIQNQPNYPHSPQTHPQNQQTYPQHQLPYPQKQHQTNPNFPINNKGSATRFPPTIPNTNNPDTQSNVGQVKGGKEKPSQTENKGFQKSQFPHDQVEKPEINNHKSQEKTGAKFQNQVLPEYYDMEPLSDNVHEDVVPEASQIDEKKEIPTKE